MMESAQLVYLTPLVSVKYLYCFIAAYCVIISTSLIPEASHSDLNRLPRRRIYGGEGIVEGGVHADTILRHGPQRVVVLEYDHLVPRHVREVEPAMRGIGADERVDEGDRQAVELQERVVSIFQRMLAQNNIVIPYSGCV